MDGGKLRLSIIVIVLAVLAATSVLDKALELPILDTMDRKADQYFQETMKRTVVTFGVVRGLNGIISVIQGTQVSVSAVAGINLAVGQILDPVNDLLERFSWVMLLASTSLGVQKVFMEVGIWLGFRIIGTCSMLVILVGIWCPDPWSRRLRVLGWRLLMVGLFIRFCMPVAAIINDGVYHLFLKEKYETSVDLLQKSQQRIQDFNYFQSAKESPDTLDMLIQLFSGSDKQTSIWDQMDKLKDRVANYAMHIQQLVVVFILQTVILPLLMLWSMIRWIPRLMDPTSQVIS